MDIENLTVATEVDAGQISQDSGHVRVYIGICEYAHLLIATLNAKGSEVLRRSVGRLFQRLAP